MQSSSVKRIKSVCAIFHPAFRAPQAHFYFLVNNILWMDTDEIAPYSSIFYKSHAIKNFPDKPFLTHACNFSFDGRKELLKM